MTWSEHYGGRHKLVRVELPEGTEELEHVRLYRRTDHYVLQWWEPSAKRNVPLRVDGDLVDAIARAREIDRRLVEFRTSHEARRRVLHTEIPDAYEADLKRRVDAGEIAAGTAVRYPSALSHYRQFVNLPDTLARYPFAARIDREFVQRFGAYLNALVISPNGHENTEKRPMLGQAFVLDACRSMFEWAADPARGELLPPGFINPFRGASDRLRRSPTVLVGEPDVTTDMAIELVTACDEHQLRLLAPVVFYGLRPGEMCALAREDVTDEYLNVPCKPKLAFMTKGRQNKSLPLVGPMRDVLLAGGTGAGLLFTRRDAPAAPPWAATLEGLVAEFNRRCAAAGTPDVTARIGIRDAMLAEAGATTYDRIDGEFRAIARRLGWPAAATLKDLRHHFATGLENAGMPEMYRKYLMGHSLGSEAIVRYTHLNQIRAKYLAAVAEEWPRLLEAFERRAALFGFSSTVKKRAVGGVALRIVK